MNLFILNTFTDRIFTGNPAAVCVLQEEKKEKWMQQVAKEINLPVTAFINCIQNRYFLRWFTPTTEIPICGHGTLASAYILWQKGYVEDGNTLYFHTTSGILKAELMDKWIQLEFPTIPQEQVIAPELLINALGVNPRYVGKNKLDYLVELDSESTVKDLKPNIELIAQLPVRGVIVTSPSQTNEYDFVSRFFSPAQGIAEDYVNGSSQCCLGPYWKNKLGKSEFTACQLSDRGGILKVKVLNDKVLLSGKVISVLEGTLTV